MKFKISKMFLFSMFSIAFFCTAILFGIYSAQNASVSSSGSIIYSVPTETTVSSSASGSGTTGSLSLPSATASRLGNITIKGNSVQSKLPSEYQEVEYIQSTGTQYIDTGFKANQDTAVKMLATSSSTANQAFFSSRTGLSNSTFSCFIVTSKVRHDYYTQQLSINVTATAGLTYDIYANKNVLTVNGVTSTIGKTNFQSTGNMYIGTSYNNGFANYFIGKIYYVQIWDNGTLIRNYIPCYRISDNVIGLYDIVNDVFYDNDGTGTFTKGANVPNPSTPQEIQSVGERTKNLFDYTKVNNLALSTTILQETAYRGYTIPCEEGDKFTISRKTLNNNRFRATFTEVEPANGVSYSGGTGINSTYDTSYSFTVTAPTGAKYLFLYLSNQGDTISEENGIQIELGTTATEYEPYGYKIPIDLNGTAHNVYLDEPLRAIGDVSDELNIAENGTITVTRKIFERTFDGTESWVKYSQSNPLYYLDGITPKAINASAEAICTHHEWTNDQGNVLGNTFRFQVASPAGRVYIAAENYATLDEFKTYLANEYANKNAVTLYYQMTTSTTTTLTQTLSLSTVAGDNTLSIGTSVAPTDISVTYIKV